MDRQEPKLGDLTNIEFRPKSYRGPSRPPQRQGGNGIIWKIALGVFAGLCLFGLVTCSGLIVIGSAVQQEQARQAEEAMKEFNKAISNPDPYGWRKAQLERQRQEARERALQPGERCISGKRFRRVDNGWVQVQKPC